jgi:CHAT domain-containing protein
VPFDLLSAHDGTEGLLIERYDISTTPTAALLLRPKPMQKRIRWPWSRQMVGFGDPLVRGDESNGAGAINRDTLQLRAAEYELRDVAKELRGNGKLYVRERDQKSIFLNGEANAAPILHVSTHAFADMDNPENSRLLFSSDTEGPAGDSLYLREMYGLNLSRVQLATFSACDTARGRVIRGEGAQAFSRALLSSGAGAALTSLWRVDDRLTAEFMRQFYYFGMRRGTSKAEALRLAKMKFLRSGSELSRPSVWAAFVLSGDGLSPLPSVVSWYALVFMTAIALVALFAALRLWRSQRVNRQHSA